MSDRALCKQLRLLEAYYIASPRWPKLLLKSGFFDAGPPPDDAAFADDLSRCLPLLTVFAEDEWMRDSFSEVTLPISAVGANPANEVTG